MSQLKISDRFRAELSKAEKLVFFTGAGISAESGIATFRGADGIWKKFKPEELANFNAFMKNPDMVWEWYQYRRKIIDDTRPNPAHLAITELQKYYSVTVVTQNVDNLHCRAGNETVFELHGNIEKNYCVKCRKRYDYIKFSADTAAPKCDCGSQIRPDIVWFGELLPADQYEGAEQAAKNCDILFSIGTSSIVYPAAGIPILARKYRKYLVEINLESTEQSHIYNECFEGKAGEVLPAILEEVKSVKAK